MEETILNLLKYQNLSFDQLKDKLSLTDIILSSILNSMINKRLIFINSKNKYNKIHQDHIIAILKSDYKNQKYIEFNHNKIFIHPEELHTAFTNDLVVIDIYNNNLGSVVGVLERKNNNIVCEVQEKNGRLVLTPFNIDSDFSIVLANKIILKKFVVGDRVIINIPNKVDDNNTIVVYDAAKIGHKDDPKADEIAIAISKGFEIDFSPEALDEAEKIPVKVLEIDKVNRSDKTDETIFTIDSMHTKDMDDAISIKKLYNGNYLLGVHIADVSYYVKPDMALFKEASRRATSLYLGDTVNPMLPHKLSNGICSLNEGVERLTKSVYMEINKKGKIVNFKIDDTVIKSRKKMTYEELNQYFETNEIDESYYPFLKDIDLLRELNTILYNAKEKRGNITFNPNEINIVNDIEENKVDFIERHIGEAESIIEDCMVLTNNTIANYFYWQDLPFIYRIHNLPDDEKIEKTVELIQTIGSKLIKLQNSYGQKDIQNILNTYKGTPEYSIISNLLLRNMPKAQYSTKNIGHFALAIDNYCHFTSPIRRFADLTIHHLLNIYNKDYSLSNLEKIKNSLDEICTHTSYKERQADDAERDYLKLKMARFMEQHVGETFEGTLIEIEHDSIVVKLDNNIKGIITYTEDFNQAFYVDSYQKELRCRYSKTKARLGTRVTIKVDGVNLPLKEIYFDIIEIHKAKTLTKRQD